MKFLVVGCGSIGERHARNLLSLGQGVEIVEPRETRRREVCEKYGIAGHTATAEAFEGATYDAVLVTNPPHLHASTALEAARHGCDLFIEKPFSHTIAGVRSLLSQARRKKLVTLVGCNLRFLKGLNYVREVLRSGSLGNLASARMHFGLYLPSWRPHQPYRESYGAHQAMGGGVILDVIHEFDYAYWLLGEVHEIFCFADKRSHLEIDTEDTASALLKFRSGVIGEIHVDYVQRTYNRGCEIIGDQGTVQWKYADQSVTLFLASENKWQNSSFPQDANDMYLDEMKHFLHCIETREESICPLPEARRVLEITLAAKKSARSGRKLSLDPSKPTAGRM